MYRESDSSERPLLVVGLLDQVIALDRRSGEVRWEHKMGSLGSAVELAIVGGRVFAVTASGYLHWFDYLDGARLGNVKLRGAYTGRATMVVDGDHLFIASGGEIVCMDRDGNEVWFNGLEGKGIGPVALGFPGNVRQADLNR